MTITEIEKIIQKYIDIINSKQTKHVFAMPTIEIIEMGKVGGNANGNPGNGPHGIVRFNKTLISENPQEYIDQIIPHEFAHVVTHMLYKSTAYNRVTAHGSEWKNVMRCLGVVPKTYHNMNVDNALINNGQKPRSVTRPYVYECPVCHSEHNITKVMHGKIQKGSDRWCNKCNAGKIGVGYEKEYCLKLKSSNVVVPVKVVKPVVKPVVKFNPKLTNTSKDVITTEISKLYDISEKFEIFGTLLKTPAKKKPYVVFSVNVGRIQVSYNSRSQLYSVLVYVSKDMELDTVLRLVSHNNKFKQNDKHHYINFTDMDETQIQKLCPKVGSND